MFFDISAALYGEREKPALLSKAAADIIRIMHFPNFIRDRKFSTRGGFISIITYLPAQPFLPKCNMPDRILKYLPLRKFNTFLLQLFPGFHCSCIQSYGFGNTVSLYFCGREIFPEGCEVWV